MVLGDRARVGVRADPPCEGNTIIATKVGGLEEHELLKKTTATTRGENSPEGQT